MTIRLSTGMRNKLCEGMGFSALFNRGFIEVYTGSQPLTADSPTTGTLLGIISDSSGPVTRETQAVGTVVITAAAGGSIDNITVGTFNVIPDGPVAAVAGDTAATAAKLCDAINRNGVYTATVSASTVTIRPRPGVGASHNGLALTGSLTTVMATYGSGTVAGGVAPVNGLSFSAPVNGVVSKKNIWSFVGVAAGTAGCFRFVQSIPDAGGASATAVRMDGSIATSGADLNLSNLSVTPGAPNTVDTFSWTQPAQ